jgi:hypothetical protein
MIHSFSRSADSLEHRRVFIFCVLNDILSAKIAVFCSEFLQCRFVRTQIAVGGQISGIWFVISFC